MDAYTIAAFALFILLSVAQQAGGRAFGNSVIFTALLLAFTLLVRFWHISRDIYEREIQYLG